jgi:hypothetical protein
MPVLQDACHIATLTLEQILLTTGKMAAAVPPNTAVRRHMAKISLPCDRRSTHGNCRTHGKDGEENTGKGDARQR